MKKVCVYCSSSNKLDKIFFEDAKKTGELLGQNGYDVVYGGSFQGLMGEVAKHAKAHSAHVLGIMPKKIFDFLKLEKGPCSDFVLTENIRDRKQKLDETSDAIIALAGGFGTLDEVFEMIDLKILGYHNKPIIFLNTDNFYNKLIEFLKDMINKKFAPQKAINAFFVAQKPEDIIEYLKNYKIDDTDFISLKLKN